jgi:dolichyl-phosphate beta-glucosyltransferase
MLEECLHYLEEKLKTNPENTFEVIIVDDGSTDKTTQIGLGYSEKYGSDKVRVLTLSNNRGKGGAVRLVIISHAIFDKSKLIINTLYFQGMLSSRGKQLLFADADGATTFEDISKLQENLQQLIKGCLKRSLNDFTFIKLVNYIGQTRDAALGLVCGSRAHLEKEAIASRSLFRTLLMKGFHLLVWLFAARSIRDTQCGFKLLTRPTAKLCFPNLHIERW